MDNTKSKQRILLMTLICLAIFTIQFNNLYHHHLPLKWPDGWLQSQDKITIIKFWRDCKQYWRWNSVNTKEICYLMQYLGDNLLLIGCIKHLAIAKFTKAINISAKTVNFGNQIPHLPTINSYKLTSKEMYSPFLKQNKYNYADTI